MKETIYRLTHTTFVIRLYSPYRQLNKITTATPDPLNFLYTLPSMNDTSTSSWNLWGHNACTDAGLRIMWFQLNMDSEGSEPKLCHKYARLRTRINGFYAFETT